jgi:hypothetical protein
VEGRGKWGVSFLGDEHVLRMTVEVVALDLLLSAGMV